ncbi:hypothetical protein F0345_17125 [Streptomyces rutgersensis]|uniref:Uncharacterized protein n=1 Tax=Streptomyces rutgersensis TaxID=53451 RepID=A0ABX6RQY2_9ACTN|nr:MULTISPECIES: hypothetical protein [Streptomyces]QNE82626.1 hypothetical protein F0345_17125 [Streptomyces rutgersensis]WPR52580.1 hypothetical protein SJI45_17615 [Streptomyces sp. S399]
MSCARCDLPFTPGDEPVLLVVDSASAAGRSVEFHQECPDERAARLRRERAEAGPG